jgi:hypothetical protein
MPNPSGNMDSLLIPNETDYLLLTVSIDYVELVIIKTTAPSVYVWDDTLAIGRLL